MNLISLLESAENEYKPTNDYYPAAWVDAAELAMSGLTKPLQASGAMDADASGALRWLCKEVACACSLQANMRRIQHLRLPVVGVQLSKRVVLQTHASALSAGPNGSIFLTDGWLGPLPFTLRETVLLTLPGLLRKIEPRIPTPACEPEDGDGEITRQHGPLMARIRKLKREVMGHVRVHEVMGA